MELHLSWGRCAKPCSGPQPCSSLGWGHTPPRFLRPRSGCCDPLVRRWGGAAAPSPARTRCCAAPCIPRSAHALHQSQPARRPLGLSRGSRRKRRSLPVSSCPLSLPVAEGAGLAPTCAAMAARSAGPPVLLGLRDAAMPPLGAGSAQAPAWATNKLGGAPDLPPGLGAASAPACGGCGAALLHVLQVSCPLEGSALHRALHVFACAAPACCGRAVGWRALRSQCAPRARPAPQEQQEKLAARDWCDEADDWGACDEFEQPELNPSRLLGVNEASDSCSPKEVECAAQLQGLSLAEAVDVSSHLCIHLPAGEERVMSSSVPVFKPYYIGVVDEEDYIGYVDTDHAHKLLKEYQQREGVNLEELMSESFAGEGDHEKYEKSELRRRDQVFHKFMKRISACPEQILRYSWGGEPLFITCPPFDISREVPACHNCGSNRVFEFQLMPALVSMLESDADLSIEFGTVLVYTCERSCWSVNQKNPLEEFIFIQEDPDQQLFK